MKIQGDSGIIDGDTTSGFWQTRRYQTDRVPDELYNFKTDPDGLVNLIDDPSLIKVKQRLKKMLFQEMKRTNDPLLEEFEKKYLNNNL